jgi:anti-sigma factor RsiW
MNCQTLDDLLLDFLYEELAPEAAREVEVHLGDCPACTKKLVAFGKVRVLAR